MFFYGFVKKSSQFLFIFSGTTGSPKGVMNSHRNLGTMLNIFIDHFRRHLLAYIHPPFLECQERELLLLPFFHCYGLGMLCHCLLVGSTGIIMAGWEPTIFCRTVQNFKASLFSSFLAIFVQIIFCHWIGINL
jgi:long-chain acyl-CoA synthetase